MKLDLKGISKYVDETVKSFTQKSTGISDVTELPDPNKSTYFILDVKDLELGPLEDEILVDQGAILKAVLEFEFYEDDAAFRGLQKDRRSEQDRIDTDLNVILDSWYAGKRDKLHDTFDFLIGMRPANIRELIVTRGFAIVELSEYVEEEPVDFGVVDVSGLDDEEEVEPEEGDE